MDSEADEVPVAAPEYTQCERSAVSSTVSFSVTALPFRTTNLSGIWGNYSSLDTDALLLLVIPKIIC